MNQNVNFIIKQLQIRSARLYWTYVIQYNQAEVYHKWQVGLSITSLIISGLVASTAFLNPLEICGISVKIGNIVIFVLGLISTALMAFMSKYDYTKRISTNVEYGTRIRKVWMKYQSLITDIKSGRYSTYEDMCNKRDELRDEEYSVLHDAPLTLQDAYEKASKKIENGHGDITQEEILAGNESQNISA